MKGDIAQRSIRSSISRTVEVRPPRMISWVTGSIIVAGPARPMALGACPDPGARRLRSAWRDSVPPAPARPVALGAWPESDARQLRSPRRYSFQRRALQDEVERSVHARAE